ncbi:MAG: type II restriction endonuclease [Candidatus Thorarchaeota archaeon]
MIAYRLSDYFKSVVAKRLSAVEVDADTSNQHEFNGVNTLRDLFGEDKCTFDADFIYLNESNDHNLRSSGSVTWYDARENHPTRTEYRLYFTGNPVMEAAIEGDVLLVGKRKNIDRVLVLIIQGESTIENQILWLFGIHGELNSFRKRSITPEYDLELGPAARYVLETIEIEVQFEDENWLDSIFRKFGQEFPSTKEFSSFARASLPDVNATDDPDGALIAWINREEMLFRTLEKYLVKKKLADGFDDVEDFISYSLSIQNRRKSRAGHALENHIEEILLKNEIRYSRNPITENRSRPDFLFPSIEQYRNPEFPVDLLRMLGVKSTCKDRWRQVLTEAKRIETKHLFTLEPGISDTQTDEMKAHNLFLVIPISNMMTFTTVQRKSMYTLAGFLGNVLGNK